MHIRSGIRYMLHSGWLVCYCPAMSRSASNELKQKLLRPSRKARALGL
jgi:hypothetical protein